MDILLYNPQSGEFDHRFFFIKSIVFCDQKIDSILKKIINPVISFQRSTWSIRSWSIFFKDRRSMEAIQSFGIKRGETVKIVWQICFFRSNRSWFFIYKDYIDLGNQFDHVQSFLKIKKIERSKIERFIEQIPNPDIPFKHA